MNASVPWVTRGWWACEDGVPRAAPRARRSAHAGLRFSGIFPLAGFECSRAAVPMRCGLPRPVVCMERRPGRLCSLALAWPCSAVLRGVCRERRGITLYGLLWSGNFPSGPVPRVQSVLASTGGRRARVPRSAARRERFCLGVQLLLGWIAGLLRARRVQGVLGWWLAPLAALRRAVAGAPCGAALGCGEQPSEAGSGVLGGLVNRFPGSSLNSNTALLTRTPALHASPLCKARSTCHLPELKGSR